MDLEKLSVGYDRLYEEASDLLKKYNPCQFEEGVCINRRERYRGSPKNGCCGHCTHLSSEGCNTKALGCKFVVCEHLYDRFPELCSKLFGLREEAVDKIGVSVLACHINKEDFLYRIS